MELLRQVFKASLLRQQFLRQVLTYFAIFGDICAVTNSRRGVDKFFLANLDLLFIKFWRNIFFTEYISLLIIFFTYFIFNFIHVIIVIRRVMYMLNYRKQNCK